MNWENLIYKLIDVFKKSPALSTALAWAISSIPLTHCIDTGKDECSKIMLNIFVITFPYQNIFIFLSKAVIIAAVIEFFFRSIDLFKYCYKKKKDKKNQYRINVNKQPASGGNLNNS